MSRRFAIFSVAVLAISIFMMLSDFADARRMGGGRSFGSSPSFQRSAPKPSTPQRSGSQPAQQGQPAPASPMGGSRWGGMLGGFLLGGVLGSLLFGGVHGFAGPGLLDILVVAGLLFFLFRFLKARRMAAESTGQAAFSSGAFQDVHSQDRWGTSGRGSVADLAIPTVAASPIPPGFDEKEFLKGAKVIYTRLQQSWDKRDLEDIRQFTSPEVWEEIRRQAEEDPYPGKTEILRVNARLLEVKPRGSETVAAVLYEVLMRESQEETIANEVREMWHFRCNENVPGSSWILEGIQQVEG